MLGHVNRIGAAVIGEWDCQLFQQIQRHVFETSADKLYQLQALR